MNKFLVCALFCGLSGWAVGQEAHLRVSESHPDGRNCLVISATDARGKAIGLELSSFRIQARREFRYLSDAPGVERLTDHQLHFQVERKAGSDTGVTRCFGLSELRDTYTVLVNHKAQGFLMSLGPHFSYMANDTIALP